MHMREFVPPSGITEHESYWKPEDLIKPKDIKT